MREIRKLNYKLKETHIQKILDGKELERYLAKGWGVKAVLPSG